MTIKEIAKLGNVSISTVSKILNKKDKDIGKETKEKILKIIEENNYIPYSKYRKNEFLKSGLIGLIIDPNNPNYAEIIINIEEEIKIKGFKLLIYNVTNDIDIINKAISELKNKNVAGIIVECNENLYQEGNIVYFTTKYQKYENQKDIFYIQQSKVGGEISKYLLNYNFRNIIYIYKNKNQELIDAINKDIIDIKLNSFSFSGTEEEILSNILSYKNNFIICENLNIVTHYFQILREMDINVPNDSALICLEENKLLEHLFGGISSIYIPIKDIIKEVAIQIFKNIESSHNENTVKEFLPKIITRNSTKSTRLTNKNKKIVVVGTMNMDTLIIGTRIPTNGSTQIANNVLKSPGGKGGNQAVGVSKLGIETSIIAKLGKDMESNELLRNLKSYNVSTNGIEFEKEVSSGKAFVQIDKNGDNTIIVFRGANDKLDKQQLYRKINLIKDSYYCLLSSEVPRDMFVNTIKVCKENDIIILFKPSSLDYIDKEVLKGIDYFIPNKSEIDSLNLDEKTLEGKTKELLDYGIKNVIVTLGKKGAYLRNSNKSLYFPSGPFIAKDTTGGADSFISALSVSLCEGNDLIYSIIFANYAAGITVTQFGVQNAMPDRETMSLYLEEINNIYLKYKNGKEGDL